MVLRGGNIREAREEVTENFCLDLQTKGDKMVAAGGVVLIRKSREIMQVLAIVLMMLKKEQIDQRLLTWQ